MEERQERKTGEGGQSLPAFACSGRDKALSRFLRELLAEPGVGLDGLLQADQPIAVGVDPSKVLRTSQKLARRDVAVVVDVHLAEPQWARGFGSNWLRHHLAR